MDSLKAKCATQTDKIVSDHSDDDSSCDINTHAPSTAEALQMLHKIRLCLLKHSSSADDFHTLEKLQSSLTQKAYNNTHQTTLDNFVKHI